MNRFAKKALLCAVTVLFLTAGATWSEAALYIPDVSIKSGIGGARRQALEADLRALEGAAALFAAQEAEAAAALDGGNHIAVLAKYTDIPSRFSPGDYSFYVLNGGWWIGVAVAKDAGRDTIASQAASEGFYGSADTETPPEGALFQNTDGAVWKQIR